LLVFGWIDAALADIWVRQNGSSSSSLIRTERLPPLFAHLNARQRNDVAKASFNVLCEA